MGSCFTRSLLADSVEADIVQIKSKVSKPRVLCLHGWRCNGEILSMQMAALQANITIECLFIDAPFPGKGEPDKGIALFYPDRPYYEWFYRNRLIKEVENEPKSVTTIYENLEESMKYLTDHLESNGPYDGLLGFSQGCSMVTRLANLQQESLKKKKDKIGLKNIFKFVILIGGVPPQVIEIMN
jgi:predicted esterase